MKLHDGTAIRVIKRIRVHDGAAVRLIRRIRLHDGVAVRNVFTFFTADINTTAVSGQYNGSSPAPQNITTGAVLAIPDGGTSPYTYSWQFVSASAYTWVFTSPTGATTSLTAQAIPPGVLDSIQFKCVVTDASGFTAETRVGTATVINNSTA